MNPIHSDWRTTTVVALCRRMLNSRDFDSMPILADALQDAECSDEELLTACQNPELGKTEAERLVNLVYSTETETAVRWLEQFVRDINYEDDDGGPSDITHTLTSGFSRRDVGALRRGT
ncbi:MAG: hypothetical protein U0792_05715 [Gemmataceae bacterium]